MKRWRLVLNVGVFEFSLAYFFRRLLFYCFIIIFILFAWKMNVFDQRWKRKLPWNVNWWVCFNFFGYNLISIVKIGDVTNRYVICPCNFFHIKQSRLMLTFPFVPLICHFLVHWQTGSGNMAASLSLNPMKERKTINALKQIKSAKCIFLPLRIKQTPY